MTQVHGKESLVLYNGMDLSGDFSSVDRQGNVDTVDTSTFGLEDHKYIAGLVNGVFNWNFIYSDATPNVEADMINPDFASETPKQFMWLPKNNVGSRAYASDQAVITAYNMGSAVSDAVKGNGSMMVKEGLRGGVLLHAHTMETTTPGTGTAATHILGTKTITSSSVANPSVITTSTPHGWRSGDAVTISGHTGATPALNNNTYVITVLTPTTFTIPVNVTVGGTGGTATRVSSRGGRLYIMATAVQGTTPSITLVLTDSADGATYATIATSAAIGAVGTQMLTIAGNIREHVRLTWTITGSSTPGVKFAALFTRNNT